MEIKSREQLVAPHRAKRTAEYDAKKINVTEYLTTTYEASVAEIKEKFPVEFFRCVGVNYDTKTDRYVGKFAHGRENEHSTVKLTNALATYLMANRERQQDGRAVYFNVYLHLDDKGCADDCLLVYM